MDVDAAYESALFCRAAGGDGVALFGPATDDCGTGLAIDARVVDVSSTDETDMLGVIFIC